MKKSTIALAVVGALSAVPAIAAESDFTFTGNVNVLTDYRFRGISQTANRPALQGGFDVAHKSGFYAGNWNSNVSGEQYPGGPGIEMDFYAGYKGEYKGIGFDIGNLYYYYSTSRYTTGGTNPDNNEVYLGLTYGPVTGKVSYATTDYFGATGVNGAKTKGTTYTELNYSKEVMPKLTLIGHVGYTDFKNDFAGNNSLSYTDYKLGVSYDLNGFALGAAYVSVDGKPAVEDLVVTDGRGRVQKLAKDTIVLSVGKTF